MIITWQGHSCFKIQDKVGTDGVTVVTDPFDKAIGLKVPNFEADIVTVSHDHHDHSNVEALRGNPFVIKSAGEYDVKGILVEGVTSFHDKEHGKERGTNIIYRIEVDGVSIVHLGDLGHKLENKQLERLGGTDILLIPVGGRYTLDAAAAVEVISQIEPRIIIPMHYQTEGLKLSTDLDSIDKFIKEIGLEPHYEEKLKITKKELPSEDMELVILSF
jgi:L-ascorbate metabolism protein UlaG (beta-lactamase superfamily)